MHDAAVHRLTVLRDMIRARPGAQLEGEPWALRGEWLVSELELIIGMLEEPPTDDDNGGTASS